MFYAAESDKGKSMTYDSPCWLVLAFADRAKRDQYVRTHSDKAETVTAKTAMKIAPELRTKQPADAWRVVVMD
jgi:hypothetical protein